MSSEFFSFHLVKMPILKVPGFFLAQMIGKKANGLNHSEHFFTMNLGETISSANRFNFSTIAFFAWWKDEQSLTNFLQATGNEAFRDGWHVRMRPYRKWGAVKEIDHATILENSVEPDQPIVAVTLARLRLSQTFRFIKWGMPVERQVRDHKGQRLALGAIRPFNTFATFSIWNTEQDMLNMVQGRSSIEDGESHKLAMQERSRKNFHYEFTTMRFMPFGESGHWNGRSELTK